MNYQAYDEHLALNAWFSQTSKETIKDRADMSSFHNLMPSIWQNFHELINNQTTVAIPKKLQYLKKNL